MQTKLKSYLAHCRDTLSKIRASQQYRYLIDRLTQYAHLMRLHRPIGIFLLLWPALWSIWIAAEGKPSIDIVIIIILGGILTRSAGCVINDYADRNIDGFVERTENRPLARGSVSPKEALGVFFVLSMCAFGLVLLLNELVMKLAIISIILIVIYPFTKRFTYMPQAFLGVTFALAVPMSFAAQAGALSKIAWLLYTTTVLWIFAYDTIYAMIDRDDDLKIGVKSTAILFGEADISIIMIIQFLVIIALCMIGQQLSLGLSYYAGVLAATACVIHQYALIKQRDRNKCFRAFLSNNYFGMVIFLGLFFHYSPNYFI